MYAGVHNVDAHTFKTAQQCKQEEAVKCIQAAYRGHQVRKSLHGNLQGSAASYQKKQVRHTSTPATTGKQKSMTGVIKPKKPAKKTVLPQQGKPTSVKKGATYIADKVTHKTLLEVDDNSSFSSEPAVVPPWEQTGGDKMSVINIYTRQYEKLQEQMSATAG